MSEPEEWRRHPRFTAYEVSDRGQVKRVAAKPPHRRGKLARPSPTKSGYFVVGLARDLGPRYVHLLVLETFAGECPAGMECRHLNGNGRDNRWPENLTWGTPLENAADKRRHGTYVRGERQNGAKLSPLRVRAILALREMGATQYLLARVFKVSRSCIEHICLKERWAHLHG